jgi:hypothetical protein
MRYQKIHLENLPEWFYVQILDDTKRLNLFNKAINKVGNSGNDLAKKLNISFKRLNRWKNAKRYIRFSYFKQIATIAKMDLAELENAEISIKGGTYCRNCLNLRFPVIIDKNWAHFSQLINTDGHIAPKRKMIEIANKNKALLDIIKNFCNNLDIGNSVYEQPHHGNSFLKITNKTLTNFFIEFLGCKAGKKFDTIKISEIILNSPKEIIASALRGAFDGDGWVCMSIKRIGIAMGSREYIKQVSQLLINSFNIKNSTYGPRDNKYTCEITGIHNIKKFKKEISFDNSYRQERLIKIISELEESYKTRFHKNCSLYECLKIIRENPNCTSKLISERLNRKRDSIMVSLKKLREKDKVLFIQSKEKGKEYKYKINSKGIRFIEGFQ